MNQEDAKREIIREWRALPKEQRQTDDQAAQFAMAYQTIANWLRRHLSMTRGLD